MLLLSVLLRTGLYYAIRRGVLVAKLVLLVGFVGWICVKTNWTASRVAEVDFAHLGGYPLVVLVRNMMMLMLMLRKSQVVAPSGT